MGYYCILAVERYAKTLNPIRPGSGGRGGEGGQKVPALTLTVNTFFDIGANATKRSNYSKNWCWSKQFDVSMAAVF